MKHIQKIIDNGVGELFLMVRSFNNAKPPTSFFLTRQTGDAQGLTPYPDILATGFSVLSF